MVECKQRKLYQSYKTRIVFEKCRFSRLEKTILVMNSSNTSVMHNAGTARCVNYRIKWPTSDYMFEHPPPEYFPMLGLAIGSFAFTSLILIVDVVLKHSKYLREDHFKLSSRVIMILTSYWLFALTGK